jgi:Protein of unknown function (DUF3558)
MTRRILAEFTIVASLVALVAAGCSKPKTADRANPSAPPPSATPSVSVAPATADTNSDACALLTKEEIQAVQGEPFKETKPSQKSGSGLIVSQCYFELPTPVNSVVLTVTRKAEGGRDPSESWQETFHREKAPERKKEEGEEKEPLKVEGIGDEAFWTGNRVGGALFVLKGNAYIRISVGGAGDQAAKIEKSKALAASALKRL